MQPGGEDIFQFLIMILILCILGLIALKAD